MRKILSSVLIVMMVIVSMATVTHASEEVDTHKNHVESNQDIDDHSDLNENIADSCDSCCASSCLHHVTSDIRTSSVMKLSQSKVFHVKEDILVSQTIYGLSRPPKNS